MMPATLYVGAKTCDFVPQWDDSLPPDETLASMLRAVWSHPFDETPLRIAADRLEEIEQWQRAGWVRAACDLWRLAAEMRPGRKDWDHDDCLSELRRAGVATDVRAWRAAGLWGSLVGCYAPAGDSTGRRMCETWADARVRAINRWTWLFGCWLTAVSQADAAWSQADAAGSQAYAAGSQANAAWSQADAAGWQADAAGWQADAAVSQAYAAWSQADAAGRQADAAVSQAYAAWSQAYAAGSQADAAGWQVWRYARRLWPIVLERCMTLEAPETP